MTRNPAEARASLVKHGPIVQVQIGFDPEYRRGKRPHLGEERFGALIDTGADQSFVDPAVADRVLMPQVDWTVLRATDGTRRTRVHLAQVYIDLPKLTLYGRFAQYPVSRNMPFDIILGRSFLQHAVMQYDGPNGTVTLAFGDDLEWTLLPAGGMLSMRFGDKGPTDFAV